MVQKERRRRGRPRAYDPEQALAQATAAFWDAGFSATSLDDLSAATGMNRPSLYGALGDKRALYLKTIEGLLTGTAATEAVMDPEIRRATRVALEEIDDAFEARFRFARQRGDLSSSADPAILAKLASAVLHTLSIRARTGAPRTALEAIAAGGVDLVCGPAKPARRRHPTASASPR